MLRTIGFGRSRHFFIRESLNGEVAKGREVAKGERRPKGEVGRDDA